MKEGYLQIKIKELEEKVCLIEDSLKKTLTLVVEKEKEIIKLSADIEPIIESGKKVIQSKEEVINKLKRMEKAAEEIHKATYYKVHKSLLKIFNKSLSQIIDQITYNLADNSTHSLILSKLLAHKKVISRSEVLEYIEKYHDECRESILSNQSIGKIQLKFRVREEQEKVEIK